MAEVKSPPAARADLAPYLPRLLHTWSAERGDSRLAVVEGTLVSVDLSGFTALSERLAAKGRAGSEELILLISGTFEGLIGVAHRHGGDVLKFRGDALLLLFSGEGHERRACEAALGMQWFIETAGSTMSSVGPVELRMATGIHTDECHFFLVESTHRELVVSGPAATATFELEDEAEAGEILVSRQTAAALDPRSLAGEKADAILLQRREPVGDGTDSAAHPTSADGLEAFVPAPLRAHLGVASSEAEHRQVTVAFLKFSGTDEILERDGPEALADQLQALARVVGETCAGYGVTWLESDIDKGAGKFYLTAGAPSSTGADEEAMLRTLRAVLAAGAGPPLRAGINRGHVFAGDIGASTRRTYAVMGDAVNLAARLCGRAQPGQIMATGDVIDRSAARYETEKHSFMVKGKEREVTAYAVGGSIGQREVAAAQSLPLVGRESEVARLREAVEAARLKQGRLVELVGEPGLGKSRLVDELKTLALGFNQLVAACERYSQSVPFFPWRKVLRPLAGITPEQSREQAGARLVPWVGTVLPELAPWLPLLAIPLDADVPSTPEVDSIADQFRLDRLQDAVEQFLERVLTMPTLLVFEDSHWMDDASRLLTTRLLGKPAPRPWLVCVTRRPEGETVIREGSPAVQLVLEPLTENQSASLALAAAQEAALSDEVLSTLAERSGGNPLFVRELVSISKEGQSLEALPESVETLMTTRIDTLEPGDRMLLRYASVVGPRFDLSLVAEVLADELPDAYDLERWERLTEFVAWDGPEALQFRHDLFRATAYEGLSFRRRRQIHGRVGDVLERRAGAAVEEAAGLLSLHFLEAGRFDKAWPYAVAAGERAQGEFANVVAAELYERALAAAAELPDLPLEEVARVTEALGDVTDRFADYERSESAYARAYELRDGDAIAQALVAAKLGYACERTGRHAETRAWFDRGLASIEDDASPEARAARASLELGHAGIAYREARYDEAIERSLRAIADAEAAGDPATLAHACYLLDGAYTDAGGKEGGPYLERALAIYEELGDFRGISIVLNIVGIHAYYEGRWDDAMELYSRSAEASRRAGDVSRTAMQKNNEAEVLSDQGRFDEARELLEVALRVCRAAHYAYLEAVVLGNIGRLAARAGEFEEAHRRFDEALKAFRELGSERFVSETNARLAECLVLEGRHAEALPLAAEALAAAPDTPVGGLEALLERQIGYALHQARRPEEARPHFAASLQLAREQDVPYQVALTLKAMADTKHPEGGEAEAEYRQFFERLGVISVPSPPLP